jgi:hypothetical protein
MAAFSDRDIKTVALCAESVVRVINESLQIANTSLKFETRISRLNIVCDKLSELKQMAIKYPFLIIPNLDEFENSISTVERETQLMVKEAKLTYDSMSGANAARLESFRNNSDVLLGVRQISTLDSHTCLICIAYSNAEWDLDGKPINGTVLPFLGGPPRHFNCRSVLVGISKSSILRNHTGTRASDEGQIDRKISFDDFLKRKSPEYVDEMLGAGRAQLWRDGKIRCCDLLNDKGSVLSLAELHHLFG